MTYNDELFCFQESVCANFCEILWVSQRNLKLSTQLEKMNEQYRTVEKIVSLIYIFFRKKEMNLFPFQKLYIYLSVQFCFRYHNRVNTHSKERDTTSVQIRFTVFYNIFESLS
jgi:hypothetical protein